MKAASWLRGILLRLVVRRGAGGRATGGGYTVGLVPGGPVRSGCGGGFRDVGGASVCGVGG